VNEQNADSSTHEQTLPSLYPAFASSLSTLQFSTPTPIQSASALQALNKENVLLIAPTGSGKSLAYLLPALTNAMDDADGTVVVIAPTRELALQLASVAKSLLINLPGASEEALGQSVQLAVQGMAAPTRSALSRASILVGTPPEVLALVENGEARELIDACKAIILDEVDVLLPPPTKSVRTSLDEGKKKSQESRRTNMSKEQIERRDRAQKRKLAALKRKGDTDATSGRAVSATERVLRAISLVTTSPEQSPQILAGSATASRKTLDVLNKVLRNAENAGQANGGNDGVRKSQVKVIRPAVNESVAPTDDDVAGDTSTPTIVEAASRAITVPSQVAHRYVSLSKEEASSADAVMTAVAKATKVLQLKPQTTALLFVCGEFGRSKQNPSKPVANTKAIPTKPKKKMSRTVQKKVFEAKKKAESMSGQPKSISARGACTKLASFGIDAQPLHVALGLEPNAAAADQQESDNDSAGFLVTFEESARGLHLDDVDVVFVVGRPASAASYLHLAGRVGRCQTSEEGVTIRPGTVVSFCTKGGTKELEKWTKQIGGTAVEELVLTA